MGRIEYRPPAVASIEFISVRGTIPFDRMTTLSSNPFVIIPALEIPSTKILIPLCASANMIYAINGLSFPMALTWDQAVTPFFEMNPRTAGGGPVSASLTWYGSNGDISFDINNINLNVKPALVWKSFANSPAADFDDVPFEVIYYLRDVLTV